VSDNLVDAVRQLLDRSGDPPHVGDLVRVTLRQPCGRHLSPWHGGYGFVQARNTESTDDDHPYFVVSPDPRVPYPDWFAAGELAEPTYAERLDLVRRSLAEWRDMQDSETGP
jgi:hypothetical protein